MSDNLPTPEGVFERPDFNEATASESVECMLKGMDNQRDISFPGARDLLVGGVYAWFEAKTEAICGEYRVELSGLDYLAGSNTAPHDDPYKREGNAGMDGELQVSGQDGGLAAKDAGYVALRFERLWSGGRIGNDFGPAELVWSHGGWENYARTYQDANGTKTVKVERASRPVAYNNSRLAQSTMMLSFEYTHDDDSGFSVQRYDVSASGAVHEAKKYYGPDGKMQGGMKIRLVQPNEIRVAAGVFDTFIARGETVPFPGNN
ncbi:hypothetical protein CR970_01915 [Candidatus Saccharibacteria bacterium]|nr:MAG: hypothetical protein CR970_01915 [Candidatus Saccharibacteria bacterium]